METIFDSGDLPVGERADAWREITASALVPSRFTFADPDRFAARMKVMPLGAVQVSAMSYAELLSQRTPELIRRSDPEFYQVALIKSGRQGIEQAGRNAMVGVGEVVLYDSSRPFDALVMDAGPLSAESILVQFPRRLLPLPDRQVARLLAVPLSARDGVGHLLAQFVTAMTGAHGGYTARDSARLAGTLIDLVAATLAHHLDRDAAMPPESRQRVLFSEISAFIHRHLADPDLRPAAIAAAHGISPRYLHRVFQQNGTTASAFIRRLRLERCRRDLIDPNLRHLTVHAIGTRWGFTRPTDFSRAFRAEFGMPPGAFRALARSASSTVFQD